MQYEEDKQRIEGGMMAYLYRFIFLLVIATGAALLFLLIYKWLTGL